MGQYVKALLKSFGVLHIFMLLLILVCFIPNRFIESNVKESLNQYDTQMLRPYTVNNIYQSIDDQVADTRTLNMIWYMNSDSVIDSVFLSNYYQPDNRKSVDALKLAVSQMPDDVTTYSRYWHGSRLLYKVLLTFMNTTQIKWFMGIISCVLLCLIGFYCVKKKYIAFFISFMLSLFGTSYWFGFVSLEYIPVIVLMLIGVLLIVKGCESDVFLFSLLGVLTAFFDFFTIETVTFTVPFLVYTYVHKDDIRIDTFVKMGYTWCIGYIFTFVYKWLLTLCMYGGNVDSVAENISNYTSGFMSRYGLLYNIKMLFLFDISDDYVYPVFFGCLFVLFVVFFFIGKRTHVNWSYIVILMFVSLIPYVRYMFLMNHAGLHYFFTYRAQICTLLAVCLLLHENDIRERRC